MSVDKSKVPRQDLRVLKKNMVYCSGVPSNLTEDELASESYFGQYGRILKIIVNPYPNKNYCSLYITYSHEFEAATAILSCNQYQMGRSTLWCLFGTMKYCRFFLKKAECKNLPNCPYLHLLDKNNQIEINNSPSQAFPQHESLARDVYLKYPDRIKEIQRQSKPDGELPSPLESVFRFREGKDLKQATTPQKSEISTAVSQQQGSQALQGKPEKTLEELVTSMILKKLEKSKGSKLVHSAVIQEPRIKQMMIAGLLE